MISLKSLAAPLIGLFILVSPGTAFADILTGDCANPANAKHCTVDCRQAPESAVCQQHANKDNPLTGCPTHCGEGILYDATNIIAILGGSAAVIVMILGALRFATSGSDISTGSRTDTDVETARRTIGGALIGLVIIILARTLILFVIGKL